MIVHFDSTLQRVPLTIWLETLNDLEDRALQQAVDLSRLPFVRHTIALMPDVHAGFGVPIGTVLGAEQYLIPNAVGFDVGCGVRAAGYEKITVWTVLDDLKERNVEVYATDIEKLPSRSRYAYKDIDQVMALQSDLVEKEIPLTPIGVIRG